MNVLLTGASGQVGKDLVHTCPDKINLLALDKHTLDISNHDNIKKIFNKFKPNLVINAAAYTSVENAEAEKELAYQINRNGVANIALACKTNNIRLIHYSTDYVFDGKNSFPYTTQYKPNPINVYGQSKLEGEKKALEINHGKTLIIRTSWIYSNHGNNFVNTMLKLMNENESIEIITDQTGTPTWARSVAKITWRFVIHPEFNGVFNFSDSGSTTWFEFAKEIQSVATKYNILNNATKIIPIATDDYPSNVKRPLYSVLDCNKTWELLNVKPDDWRTSLGKMLRNYNQ
jgi:dTDP-4-dehydrorhamnose reductase